MRGCVEGFAIPAWYLLLVPVLGILSGCQSLRDLERFAIRHHVVLTEALGVELRRPPSDYSFRYFFLQVDVVAVCAAGSIRSHPDGSAVAGSLRPSSISSPLMSCAKAAMPSVTDQIPFSRRLLIAMVRSIATI
jgi:hypothetical protein